MKPYIPLGIAAFAAAASFIAIWFLKAPATASDWGTLLSAAVSIMALGALLTTLGLQREELGLQRLEIARLAASSQEQTLHTKRQTLIESYRGLDEKVSQVFSSDDFNYLMQRAKSPSNLESMCADMCDFEGEISTVSFQGIHNVEKYRFITSYHTFPISFSESDGLGGSGVWRKAEVDILSLLSISGIRDASALVKHIYSLARDLDLLDYTRSVMARRCSLEPLLYVSSEWGSITAKDFFGFSRLNPAFDEKFVRDDVDFHVENSIQHYNLATSMLAGARYNLSILSPDAQRPVESELLLKYPPLKAGDDDVPF